MDILILLLLILLNGVFAMCEIAVVSSRKARLQNLANDGSTGAWAALRLHNDPSRFLSTVQVGITSVGILSGAIGETALADPLTAWLAQFHAISAYARTLAMIVVVVGLTYFSVVIGELVPKQLGLLAPERIASLVSRPMTALAYAARPLVWSLSTSSAVLLRLIGARRGSEHPVTDEEIYTLMGEGAESGVFHESEQELVSNVLRLDDQRVSAIMTHRRDLCFVDLSDTREEIARRLADCPYEHLVVCQDTQDNVIGILRRVDLLATALAGRPVAIEEHLAKPLFVPESQTTIQLVASLRHARADVALVVDEYGQLEGMVTQTDILESILGEELLPGAQEAPDVVPHPAGGWIVAGDASIERLKRVVEVNDDLPGEDENRFNTLGGFIIDQLGRIPSPGDGVVWERIRMEVLAVSRNRIERVYVFRQDAVDQVPDRPETSPRPLS